MTIEYVHVAGWKGKDDISILEGKDYYKIIFHRKDKETSECYEDESVVEKKIVENLLNMIYECCDVGERYGYKFLVRKWIERNKINSEYGLTTEQMIDTFNGGKYRKLEYFPFYNSLKVLESKGIIIYRGRGGIILLKKWSNETLN